MRPQDCRRPHIDRRVHGGSPGPVTLLRPPPAPGEGDLGATRSTETNWGLYVTQGLYRHSFLLTAQSAYCQYEKSGLWAGLGRAEEITLFCCSHLSDFNKSLAWPEPENICLNVPTICEGAAIREKKE